MLDQAQWVGKRLQVADVQGNHSLRHVHARWALLRSFQSLYQRSEVATQALIQGRCWFLRCQEPLTLQCFEKNRLRQRMTFYQCSTVFGARGYPCIRDARTGSRRWWLNRSRSMCRCFQGWASLWLSSTFLMISFCLTAWDWQMYRVLLPSQPCLHRGNVRPVMSATLPISQVDFGRTRWLPQGSILDPQRQLQMSPSTPCLSSIESSHRQASDECRLHFPCGPDRLSIHPVQLWATMTLKLSSSHSRCGVLQWGRLRRRCEASAPCA